MNREQTLIALVLSVPPAVGITSAIHLSAPSMLAEGATVGLLTFLAIFGLIAVAVRQQPSTDEDMDADAWPGLGDPEDRTGDEG